MRRTTIMTCSILIPPFMTLLCSCCLSSLFQLSLSMMSIRKTQSLLSKSIWSCFFFQFVIFPWNRLKWFLSISTMGYIVYQEYQSTFIFPKKSSLTSFRETMDKLVILPFLKVLKQWIHIQRLISLFMCLKRLSFSQESGYVCLGKETQVAAHSCKC